jgi:hypothetical protein
LAVDEQDLGIGLFLLFHFLAVLGFELRASLARRVLYLVNHAPSLFSLMYFLNRVLCLLELTWTLILLCMPPSKLG